MGVVIKIMEELLDRLDTTSSNLRLPDTRQGPVGIPNRPGIDSPGQRPCMIVSPSSKVVQRQARPLWIERGWVRSENRYSGYYRTRYGAYQGRITERYEGYFEFLIWYPPKSLKNHSHAACFMARGGGKYEIHFSTKARTPDEGILAIEKIIAECHTL